jgi:hypothetical protein
MPVSQSSQLSSQVKRSLEGCDARLGKLSKDALPSSLLLNSVISLASRLSRVEPWRVAQYSRISNFLRPSALIETARGRRRVARTAQSPVNIMSPCGTAHFISRSSHHRRRSRASTGVKGSSRREKSRSELVEQAACSAEEREWRSSWALKGRPGPTVDCITHTGPSTGSSASAWGPSWVSVWRVPCSWDLLPPAMSLIRPLSGSPPLPHQYASSAAIGRDLALQEADMHRAGQPFAPFPVGQFLCQFA